MRWHTIRWHTPVRPVGLIWGLFVWCMIASAAEPDTRRGDALVAEYFQRATRVVADRCLADIRTAADWNARKDEYRRQLREMLGLDPWPEKTPLEPVITGRLQKQGIIVENLHFQSSPGLYVTGNLYRPETVTEKLPAVLYVCGHSNAKEDGVAYGNKTSYQHHGAWLARNGYVCLTIDTIQLGEIEGIHHGTHRFGMWWWPTRGYTPAGVEAWNGIRALDYLETRDEVDPKRIGMTGRSGGGAYTWWVAALDERVQCAVPVAGITNMQNHVVDDCIEGHCDCMFMVNRYGWDFPLLAALVAPRPLLVGNSDKDRIFPLDGVVDVYQQARRIYRLLGAEENIGLAITEGPHKDTQPLQINAFSWLNRFLKNDDPPISMIAEKLFTRAELKTFESLPADERVTTAHDWFVPEAEPTLPSQQPELEQLVQRFAALQEQVFHRWANRTAVPLDVKLVKTVEGNGRRLRTYSFLSEAPYRLRFDVLDGGSGAPTGPVRIEILDADGWEGRQAEFQSLLAESTGAADAGTPSPGTRICFAPRGIGETEWSRDAKKRTQIQRRFLLLGTTLDSVRAFDTRRALAAIAATTSTDAAEELSIQATGAAGIWLLLAVAGEESPLPRSLTLTAPPVDWRDGPSFLQAARLLSLPQLLLAAGASLNDGEKLQLQPAEALQLEILSSLVESAGRLGVSSISLSERE